MEENSPRTDGIQTGAETPRDRGIGGKKGVCVCVCVCVCVVCVCVCVCVCVWGGGVALEP